MINDTTAYDNGIVPPLIDRSCDATTSVVPLGKAVHLLEVGECQYKELVAFGKTY